MLVPLLVPIQHHQTYNGIQTGVAAFLLQQEILRFLALIQVAYREWLPTENLSFLEIQQLEFCGSRAQGKDYVELNSNRGI